MSEFLLAFGQSIHIFLMSRLSILIFLRGGGGSFLEDRNIGTQDLSGVAPRNLGSGKVQY